MRQSVPKLHPFAEIPKGLGSAVEGSWPALLPEIDTTITVPTSPFAIIKFVFSKYFSHSAYDDPAVLVNRPNGELLCASHFENFCQLLC